jgi:hypothetical protein
MDLTLICRPGFDVKYLGSITTGKHGDVKQIDNAMGIVLFNSHGSHHPALFEIQEIGIKVTENATGKVCDPYTKNTTSRQCGLPKDCETLANHGLSQPAPINNWPYLSDCLNIFLLLALKKQNCSHAFLITTKFLKHLFI